MGIGRWPAGRGGGELALAGAEVTICDFNADRGEALAEELGGHVAFIQCDVTDAEQVDQAVTAASANAPLRINVNCAGTGDALRTVNRDGTPHDYDRFMRVININLIGTFNTLRHCAAIMSQTEPLQDGQRGVIINSASIAAFDGQIGQLAYSASKGAIVALTLPVARDLSSAGIRCNTIAPGLMDTPLLGLLPHEAKNALGAGVLFPKRLGSPENYAALALHIIENDYLNG